MIFGIGDTAFTTTFVTGGHLDVTVDYTIGEKVAAAAAAAVALALSIEAYDEWKTSTDLLEEAMNRQIAMVQDVYGHTIGVTHAYARRAMSEALNYPIDSPDYGGVCSRMGYILDRANTKLLSADAHYNRSFKQSARQSGQIGASTGMAGVDAAFARAKSQERRRNRQKESKAKTVLSAHRGTNASPATQFGLMDNAVQLHQNLSNSAIAALGGNLATFGASLTTALSGLGQQSADSASGGM